MTNFENKGEPNIKAEKDINNPELDVKKNDITEQTEIKG